MNVPTEGTYTVTPEVADKWRIDHHYKGQRVFKAWHANNLRDEMLAGRFRAKTQIGFCYFDGSYFLTNGQHTLAAIASSGRPQLLNVVINKVSSMREVADDFARHDTHLTRLFGDSLVAHDMHAALGVTSSDLHAITAACTYYANLLGESPVRAQMLTHDKKMYLVERYGQLAADALALFAGSSDRTAMRRKTTLASAMITLAHAPDVAPDFWRAIAEDDGLRKGDPRKTYLDYVTTRVTPGGMSNSHNTERRSVAADHEMVKAAASAWNAWIAGRELKIIRNDFDQHVATFDRCGSYQVRTASRKARDRRQAVASSYAGASLQA